MSALAPAEILRLLPEHPEWRFDPHHPSVAELPALEHSQSAMSALRQEIRGTSYPLDPRDDRAQAWARALFLAAERRHHSDLCCPHASDAGSRGDSRIRHIHLGLGLIACDDCVSGLLERHPEVEQDGHCDVCDAYTDTFFPLAQQLGPTLVFGDMCKRCRDFMLSDNHAIPIAGRAQSRARWEDALDVQIHLLDLARRNKLLLPDIEGLAQTSRSVFSALRNSSYLGDAIQRADPIFVSADVCAAWKFAERSFRPEPIRIEEPMAERGLAVFATPIRVLAFTPISAAVWQLDRREQGFAIIGFARLEDLPEDAAREARDHGLQDWVALTTNHLPLGRDFHDWVNDRDEVASSDAGPAVWRSLQALWRMARQLVLTADHPPRPVRRRAERANLTRQHVTVIRLRRQAKHESGEERPTDWSCQWVVRGHWRDQWYPSAQTHRQKYIAPYVKGPEDKPLRITDRVFEFVR